MSRNNFFGCNEVDKIIENIINRDCKIGGGYIGFSVNFVVIQRWVLNELRCGLFRKLFREYLLVLFVKVYVYKELVFVWIKIDLEVVGKVVDFLEGVFSNFWVKEFDFIILFIGVVVIMEVCDDLF